MSDPSIPPQDPTPSTPPPHVAPPGATHQPPPGSVPPPVGRPPPHVGYAGTTTPSTGLFAPPYSPGTIETNPDAKLWGMLAHLSALLMFVVPSLGQVIGPLVVWLIKKDQHPFVDDQGKESLNFQITMTILALVSSPLICVGIGIILLIAIAIASVAFAIVGGIKANNGEYYRYPFSMRLIK